MTHGENESETRIQSEEVQVTDRVLTIPNVITVIRLCMIVVFVAMLQQGHNLVACFVYAVAAGTDCIDGKIARATNSVSRIGQLLDPAVDRLLMISGVLGLLLISRLPLWIVIAVMARDVVLLVGGACLLGSWQIRVPVIFAGKVGTTLLFIGFAGMLLNMPLISGLGLVSYAWLPGFNSNMVSWGIWFIYAGIAIGYATAVYYISAAWHALVEAKSN